MKYKNKSISQVRKFYVTYCHVCGGIDGAVEQLKEYNSERDRKEWAKEGRAISEFVQKKGDNIPWCTCPIEDEVEEVK